MGAKIQLSLEEWQSFYGKANERNKGFKFSEACFPVFDEIVFVFTEGWKATMLIEKNRSVRVFRAAILVSCEKIFDVFMDLLSLFRKTVCVVLESSHDQDEIKRKKLCGQWRICENCKTTCRKDFLTRETDPVVLQSHLCDFENLLVNDGCMGIIVSDPCSGLEIRLDDHKTLLIYNWKLAKRRLKKILRKYGIPKKSDLVFFSEKKGVEHIHRSSLDCQRQFEELKTRLSAEEV